MQYKNIGATRKDVVDVVTTYRSLTYDLQKFGKYFSLEWAHCAVIHTYVVPYVFLYLHMCVYFFIVFNDGSSKDLFTLQGTIPVVYKSELQYMHSGVT